MSSPRISASSYSNTAPLIWTFLYGSQHGRVELILDNAPARSAELLAQDRVDAALVPVIAYHEIDGTRLVRDVCVGAKEKVRSVCLVTRGMELGDVRSVALDVSSRTSVVLTKIIFREFLGFEPEWRRAEPDIDAMLDASDAALLIGDPALSISDLGFGISDLHGAAVDSMKEDRYGVSSSSEIRNLKSRIQKFDLAELWSRYTSTGFVFAMWMSRRESIPIDFAAARDEGLDHIDEIVSNYESAIGLQRQDLTAYLTENISYSVDETMLSGMELYFDLAEKCGLVDRARKVDFLE
jgi:chorismate dehydratase